MMGLVVNHKRVQRLMGELGLKSKVRPKRYKSYKGEVGKVAENVLKREFTAKKPNQKWVTDVTEFKVNGQKVYLSPIIDLFNQEVVSYEVRTSVTLPLVTDMLKAATAKLLKHEKPLLHSDQGWQYQNIQYQQHLKKHGLLQSMSRKGNCLDNAVAENFFGILKTEMYHNKTFKDANELILFPIERMIEKVNKIVNSDGKDIWLFGGASLTNTMIKLDLVDELMIAIHPLILGSGKPLFEKINMRKKLKLTDTKTYSTGLVQVFYEIQK